MKTLLILITIFTIGCIPFGNQSPDDTDSTVVIGLTAIASEVANSNSANKPCSSNKTSTTWNIVPDKDNNPITDPAGTDGFAGSRDLVGNSTYPTFYTYFDESFIYFRLRVNSSPLHTSNNFSPFSWGLLVDSNKDDNHYEWLILLDGITNPDTIRVGQKTNTANAGVFSSVPDIFHTITGTMTATAASPSLDGDDYFVDIKIDYNEFKQITNINQNDSLRYFIGTSSTTNSISQDTIAGSYINNFSSYVNLNGIKCD